MGHMAASDGPRSPGSKLAIRVAILALVAGLGAVAHGILGVGDDPDPSAGPADAPGTHATPTPDAGDPADPSDPGTGEPGTGEEPDSDRGTSPDDDAGVPHGGVPSGVTGGVGDDVGIHDLRVLTARAGRAVPAHADLAGISVTPARHTGRIVTWARDRGMGAYAAPVPGSATQRDLILWRADRFTAVDAGTAHGTRSLRTDSGLEARRILWVTLLHTASGEPVSYVLARLEPGDDPSARAANAAYLERVAALRDRLSRTSTVVVGVQAGARQRVTVPDGNVHEGVVLAVRDRTAVRGGQVADLTLQAPGVRR